MTSLQTPEPPLWLLRELCVQQMEGRETELAANPSVLDRPSAWLSCRVLSVHCAFVSQARGAKHKRFFFARQVPLQRALMGAAHRVTLALLIWEFLHVLSSEKPTPSFPVFAKPERALIEMDGGDYTVSSACCVSLEHFQQRSLFFSGLEQNPSSSEHQTSASLPSHVVLSGTRRLWCGRG